MDLRTDTKNAMCSKEIGLHVQILLPILGSIVQPSIPLTPCVRILLECKGKTHPIFIACVSATATCLKSGVRFNASNLSHVTLCLQCDVCMVCTLLVYMGTMRPFSIPCCHSHGYTHAKRVRVTCLPSLPCNLAFSLRKCK